MKYKWITGIMLAVAFFLSGASFASPFTDNGLYAEPVFNVGFVFAVDPPLVPAVKPHNGFTTAMATSGDLTENDEFCIASCQTDKRTSISVNFYQLKTENLLPQTVLACGYQSIPKDRPYKVPISKAV